MHLSTQQLLLRRISPRLILVLIFHLMGLLWTLIHYVWTQTLEWDVVVEILKETYCPEEYNQAYQEGHYHHPLAGARSGPTIPCLIAPLGMMICTTAVDRMVLQALEFQE